MQRYAGQVRWGEVDPEKIIKQLQLLKKFNQAIQPKVANAILGMPCLNKYHAKIKWPKHTCSDYFIYYHQLIYTL